MKNNPIRSTLKQYFEPGDVPTAVEFAEFIDAALDLSVANSMLATQVVRTVDAAVEDHIDNLEALSDAMIAQYALLSGQTILLTAQQNGAENGLYLFDGSACQPLYSNTVNENIANLDKVPAAQVSRLQLVSGEVVCLMAQTQQADNGIYRYVAALSDKTALIEINEKLVSLTDISESERVRLGLTEHDYVHLLAQTDNNITNGIYQLIGSNLIKVTYSAIDDNIADITRLTAAEVSQFALTNESWVLLQAQGSPQQNGLYLCHGSLVDRQTPFFLAMG